MTAPLVEPRYFILPWIFWRLLVPTPTLSPSSFLPKKSPAPSETIVALCPHPTSRKYNIPTLDHVDGEDDNKMPTSANATPDLASSGTVAQSKRSGQGRSGGLIVSIVLLEMFWFILINTVTMYVFVTRPFYWRAPGGMLLDKGRVQRFMW
jgi:alpha-1,2-glucosyltransferase